MDNENDRSREESMWKKLGLVLVIAMSLTSVLSAAERVSSPIPPQPSDKKAKDFGRYLVSIRPTLPASVTNDDPLTPYTERIKPMKGFTSEWFFIHVRFPVYAPGRNAAWAEWLDDVEVMVEVCIPGKNKKGQTTYVVLQGRQKLNSIYANDDVHNVRFFIPPYAIFRYIAGLQEKMDLKKMADELPVLVTVFWRENPICYIMRSKDADSPRRATYFKLFEKLRDSKSNYYDNVILPAEYTPWAARDLERFESMKFEKIGSR